MAPRKNKRSETSKAIAQAIDQYKPTSAEEMQDALKDIFGPMFEAMLQGEMDSHLGYESNDCGYKDTSNRRNGYTHKTLKTTMGDVEIDTPRDREGSFDPQLIPKRTKDVSGIEDKVLSMYAKGMSQRDIADTIEDIYGFEISYETISNITDQVIETANKWQILLHKAAKNAFDELHLKKLPKVKDLNAEYAEILAEKKKLYGEYRQVKKDMQENQRAKYDID